MALPGAGLARARGAAGSARGALRRTPPPPVAVRAGAQRRLARLAVGAAGRALARRSGRAASRRWCWWSARATARARCAARALPLARARAAVIGRARDPAARTAADLPGRVRLPRLRAHGRAARPGPLHALPGRSRRRDPVFGFIGWPFQHSPYGPLFTLASYAAAPLGVAGGLWALKALAALGSLGAIWLTPRPPGGSDARARSRWRSSG